ncbi:MAG: Lon-like protease helical domain-containing protein [Candidatus Sedimenticola endophacoides]
MCTLRLLSVAEEGECSVISPAGHLSWCKSRQFSHWLLIYYQGRREGVCALLIFGGGSVEKALTPGQLYHRCDLGQFGFQDTSQIDGLERAVGQERALDAIDFGVGMEHGGYNLYVMGSTGLGRHTMVYEALRRQAEAEMAQSDWCYVSNFTDPSMPGALRLPAGTGRELSRDMRALVEGKCVATS